MALDKLVDSTQLDGALTATANAIRVKTGDSGTITWNASTGFANAVGDIQAGATITALSVTENGTYTAPTGTAYSPVTVDVSSIVTPVESGVEFFDYDGTLLYAYTTTQALQLTALPANPSHTGLTAQGWNWSLAEIKSYLTDCPNELVLVGQMYITDDGKTRIYIHLGDGRKAPLIGLCVNGSVDIDWGDGTQHSTLAGSSISTTYWTDAHTYNSGGDYVITLSPTGTIAFTGKNATNNYAYILRQSTSNHSVNMHFARAIDKIEIGANALINFCAFSQCSSLKSITIPNTITTIEGSAFTGCNALKNVVLPSTLGAEGLGPSCFQNCYSMENIELPASLKKIDTSTFDNCRSLTRITMPLTAQSLGANAFIYCYTLKHIMISKVTPSYGTIGSSIFSYCVDLRDVEILDLGQVTSLPASMFAYCHSLTKVVIPNTITSIGSQTFGNCSGLSEIHFLGETPPSISSNSFYYLPADYIIYVPYSSDHSILAAYKGASNWSSLESHIQEEPQ